MTDPITQDLPLLNRVDDWLRAVANDDEMFRLLKLCFGRVILNQKMDDFAELKFEVGHCRRWLQRAIRLDSDWLRRTDNLGRPKKLMKFSDIPGIMREIQKCDAKVEQSLAQTAVAEGDEEWFADLDGGFHLVKLKSRQALTREGGALQNCLGDGGYDDRLAKAEFTYLVLRDRRSRSHVIVEVSSDDNRVIELRGKQNATPLMKYLAPLAKFFAEREWPIRNHWRRDFLIDDVGVVHEAVPDRLCLRGDLFMEDCKDVVFPRELAVSESIYVNRCTISKPAEHLTTGYLLVEGGSGDLLAWDISVRNMIEYTPDAAFLSIGKNVSVDGPLQMEGNQHIEFMPVSLRVSDWFGGNSTRFLRFGEDTRILGVIGLVGATASGSFCLDADRNVIHAGDMVEIVGNVKGVNRGRHGDLRGTFGSLVEPLAHDGGLIEYPGEGEVRTLGMISTSFRRVSKVRISGLDSQYASKPDGTIVVDVATADRSPAELDDEYDFGTFDFDVLFDQRDGAI
jgi:hypothetical protein